MEAPTPRARAIEQVRATTLSDEWAANLNAFRHRLATWVMVIVGRPVAHMTLTLVVAIVASIVHGSPPRDPEIQVTLASMVGIGVATLALFYFRFGGSLWTPWASLLRYKANHLREAIQRREGIAFDFTDPRVVLVQFWLPLSEGKAIANPEWQFGFFLLDEHRGEALFEGDRHRVVIPAGAITAFNSRLEREPSVEGSPPCSLSVHTRSEFGEWQIDIQVESGLPGNTYHEREEALRVRWQHLVDGRPSGESL